jgi:hypothetical protein
VQSLHPKFAQVTGGVAVAGGQVEIDREQMLDELGRPREQAAVGRDDHRVAVEDQLVLATDHVHVRDGGPGLGAPAPYQW